MTDIMLFYKDWLPQPCTDDDHGNRHPKANPPTVGSAATTLRQNSFWIIPYIRHTEMMQGFRVAVFFDFLHIFCIIYIQGKEKRKLPAGKLIIKEGIKYALYISQLEISPCSS